MTSRDETEELRSYVANFRELYLDHSSLCPYLWSKRLSVAYLYNVLTKKNVVLKVKGKIKSSVNK